MYRHSSFLLGLAGCAALTLLFASNASACESVDKKPKVKVSVVNGQPSVDPASLEVCVGDEVHWVFPGSEARQFMVKFKSLEDSPFNWPEKKGASVTGTIRADAVKDNAPTPYTYDVQVDGVDMDPMIIVKP